MTTESPNPSRWSTVAAWSLGLFAVWQFLFPVLANVLEFIPLRPTAGDRNPPLESTQRWGRFTSNDTLQSSAEWLGYALAWYGQLTGQEHGWDMFTPGFPPYTVVPFAELHTPNGITQRESRFDPLAHDQPWMRWPLRYDREFNYEANLFMLAWHHDPRLSPHQADQPNLPGKVRENEQLILRWLKYQWKQHPEASEVRLMLRYIPIAKPGQPKLLNPEPVVRPFARWQPGHLRSPGFLSLEAYDPKTDTFVKLPAWED